MIDINQFKINRDIVIGHLFEKAEELKKLILDLQTVTIDLDKLPDYISNSERKKKPYYQLAIENVYEKISKEKRGAVYFFHLPKKVEREIIVKVDREVIVNAIKDCKHRSTPSVHKIEKRDFKVLYVGSVKSDFRMRFFQHLGYGAQNTAALQLIHWAKPLFEKIELTYIPIPYSELSLHTLMESAMCRTLVPMIGRMERDTIN